MENNKNYLKSIPWCSIYLSNHHRDLLVCIDLMVPKQPKLLSIRCKVSLDRVQLFLMKKKGLVINLKGKFYQ